MKNRLLWMISAAAVLPLAVWLGAQTAVPRKALAELAPGNALLWVEAPNFNGLVGSWDASSEKKTWLASSTYQSYIRSKLALRLEEVQKAYAEGVGVNPSYALLTNLAGGESAVAVYDVGKLELLYLTRLPAARIADNLLVQGRAKFQTRNAGGQTYYAKSSNDGSVAFAAVGDLLIAGTREDLVAGALQLLAGQRRPSVRQERWYADALAKAGSGAAPDVRLVVNVERTVKTPHFRSYWIQRNITDTAQYYASISDLRMGAGAWTEHRSLLRREARAAVDESGVAKLARLIPADAGFYQAWAKPSAAQVEQLLRERIQPRGDAGAADPADRRAPDAEGASEQGGEDQLEDRVDAVESGPQSGAALPLPIVTLASTGVEAVAQVLGTRAAPGGVFTSVDSAIILVGGANWNENAVKAAVQSSAERAWSAGALSWSRRGSSAAWELSGLSPVYLWTQGNLLAISNSAALLDKITAANNTQALAGAYLAGYRHGQENANYARLMRLIDYPQIPASENGARRAPMLFSETLGDVGRVLQGIDTASIEAKDDGAVLRQTVTYRKRP